MPRIFYRIKDLFDIKCYGEYYPSKSTSVLSSINRVHHYHHYRLWIFLLKNRTLLGKNPPAARIASMSLLLISCSSTMPHDGWHAYDSSGSTLPLLINLSLKTFQRKGKILPFRQLLNVPRSRPINNRTPGHALLLGYHWIQASIYLSRKNCLFRVFPFKPFAMLSWSWTGSAGNNAHTTSSICSTLN